MHWWASHDAEGINFHTGNHRESDENQVPGGYDISYSTPSGLKLHPIAYALKAFSFSNAGRSIPVSIRSQDEHLNLTAYGVVATDKSFILTLINKESGAGARDANITVDAGKVYTEGKAVLLNSPDKDVGAVTGTTLGDAAIVGNGAWNGTWSQIPAPAVGKFILNLPAATAAVIRLWPK